MNYEDLIYLGACLCLLIIFIGFIIAILLNAKNKRNKREKIRQETRDNIHSKLREKGLNLSHRIELIDYYSFIVDKTKNKVACCNYLNNSFNIINFSDLIRCEIVTGKKTIRTGSSANTALGGILGGAAGAIIMESTRKNKTRLTDFRLNVISCNIQSPVFTFPLLRKDLPTQGSVSKIRLLQQERKKFVEMVYLTVESIVEKTSRNNSSIMNFPDPS